MATATKADLEKEVSILKGKLTANESYIATLKQTIETQENRIHNLEMIYTRKSMGIMDAVRTLYRHLSLELEDQK